MVKNVRSFTEGSDVRLSLLRREKQRGAFYQIKKIIRHENYCGTKW